MTVCPTAFKVSLLMAVMLSFVVCHVGLNPFVG